MFVGAASGQKWAVVPLIKSSWWWCLLESPFLWGSVLNVSFCLITGPLCCLWLLDAVKGYEEILLIEATLCRHRLLMERETGEKNNNKWDFCHFPLSLQEFRQNTNPHFESCSFCPLMCFVSIFPSSSSKEASLQDISVWPQRDASEHLNPWVGVHLLVMFSDGKRFLDGCMLWMEVSLWLPSPRALRSTSLASKYSAQIMKTKKKRLYL